MKKTIVFIAFLLLASFGFAQISVRVGAGVNFSTPSAMETFNETEYHYATENRMSLQALAEVDLRFSYYFSARIGVGFSQHSGDVNYSSDPLRDSLYFNYRLAYLNFPVQLVANFPVGNSKFYLGVGPTFSIGTRGRMNIDDFKSGQTSDDVKISWDGKSNYPERDHLKRLHMGLNFTAGVQLKAGLFLQANYQYGLSNISPIPNSEFKMSHFGISIGFRMFEN